MRLLDRYGASALQSAVLDALARQVPHPNAVRLALERAREAAGQPPPVALVLPEHVARRDAPVRAHALGSYDRQVDHAQGQGGGAFTNDHPEETSDE